MGKIFKVNDFYDWEAIVEARMGDKYIKTNKAISIILNIIVPSILLFVLKVNFITYLLCFICFDIFQVVLEYISIYIYSGAKSIAWFAQKKQYVDKIKSMTPVQIESFKKELSNTHTFYNEKLAILNKQIEEYKSFDTIATPSVRKNDIAYVEEVIMKLKNYNNIEWIKTRMKDIVDVSERLISLVKDDPDSVQAIINTYNIYAEELLNIIVQYEDMDIEQKEKYEPKIEKLMDVFYHHIEEKENKIQSYKEHTIDFDIDFLTKKLTEEENSV